VLFESQIELTGTTRLGDLSLRV